MDEEDRLVEQLSKQVVDYVRQQLEEGRPFVTEREIYTLLGAELQPWRENRMFVMKDNHLVEYQNTKVLHFPMDKIRNKNS